MAPSLPILVFDKGLIMTGFFCFHFRAKKVKPAYKVQLVLEVTRYINTTSLKFIFESVLRFFASYRDF